MRLRTYLDQENIPVAAFARRIGVSVAALHRYLAGDRFPRQEVMQAIIDNTNGAVQANDLFAELQPKASSEAAD
jgi:transcriptional regulator with XRE-family HTH domain